MDDRVLEYKVGEHDKRLDEHDRVLGEHEHKINDLATSNIRLADSVDNLAKNMEKGFGYMKWFLGLLASGIVGFFFYMIQSLF